MSQRSKRELSEVVRPRYLKAKKTEKVHILDESAIATTGYHRKYAMRILKHGRLWHLVGLGEELERKRGFTGRFRAVENRSGLKTAQRKLIQGKTRSENSARNRQRTLSQLLTRHQIDR